MNTKMVWKQMCYGNKCVVETNVLWKQMCYGNKCAVETNVLSIFLKR